MTLILGIETSCDETAAAVIEDGRVIRANVVASQVDLHAPYGGVFPEVASRAHIEIIGAVVQQAIDEAGITYDAVDAVAVTRGPGLPGGLLVGVNFAKGLAMGRGLPLVGVNHLEGHIFSLWLAETAAETHEGTHHQETHQKKIQYPVLALIVSGGHTELVLVKGPGAYVHLGGTQDDAAGEAFDKVARLLELGYPGGPAIQQAASSGRETAFKFPQAKTEGPYDFSFSGLKTAVLRAATVQPARGKRRKRGEEKDARLKSNLRIEDVAASFQKAVVDALVEKTVAAANAHHAAEIHLSGGVSANTHLRDEMHARAGIPVRVPPLHLCTDNAAMIGAAGYVRFMAGQRDGWDMDVQPMWPVMSLEQLPGSAAAPDNENGAASDAPPPASA